MYKTGSMGISFECQTMTDEYIFGWEIILKFGTTCISILSKIRHGALSRALETSRREKNKNLQ